MLLKKKVQKQLKKNLRLLDSIENIKSIITQFNEKFSWEDAVFDFFIQTNLLKKLEEPASIFKCNDCEDFCHKEVIRHSGRKFIACDGSSPIDIEDYQLEQWIFSIDILIKQLCFLLGKKEYRTITDDRVWNIGFCKELGKEVFLIRGVNWNDADDVIWKAIKPDAVKITLTDSNKEGTLNLIDCLDISETGLQFYFERIKAISVPAIKSQNIFKRNGDIWEVSFNGIAKNIKHTKGMQDIHTLLSNPNQEISAEHLYSEEISTTDISSNEAMQDGLNITSSYQEAIDGKTINEIKSKITSLKEEEREAEEDNLNDTALKKREEREKLEEFLLKNTKKDGKSRNFSNEGKKAKDTVSKRIKRVVDKFEKEIPDLYKHFTENNNLKFGYNCSYNPSNQINWILH